MPDLVPDPDAASCANCGAALEGPWCGACGQRRVERRLHLREVLRDLRDKLIDVETGFLHTAWTALVRPDRVVTDWLRGRRKPYTPPLRFVVVGASLSLILNIQLLRARPLDAKTQQELAQMRDLLAKIGLADMDFENLSRWTQWTTLALGLPALAAATSITFRPWRRTFAEHLATASFVYGAWILLGAMLMVTETAVGLRTGGGVYPLASASAPLWIGWALMRAHPGAPRSDRFARSLGALGLCLVSVCVVSCGATVLGIIGFLVLR